MIPRSLGARSVLAALASIVLALVVVAAGVDLLVGRQLHRSLDRSLRQRAVEVAQLSATAPALLLAPGSLDTPASGAQLVTQVVDRRGRLVARSLGLGGRVLPIRGVAEQVISSGHGRYLDAQSGSDDLRVYLAPLADSGGVAAGGAVAVAASTESLEQTLSSVRLFVLVAALIAATVATLALTFLMRRALAPLGRLTRAAAEIEQTGDPRRRLPQPEGDDEVGRLAATLNRMLAAFERTREGERRFLADASHELRTPLTALVGNVSYLAQHGANAELIADLEHDTDRLARLANDLLTLSREESGAAVLPDEVVRLDELARRLEGADLELEGEPVSVRGDRDALARALENLVENARRYGEGVITVETRAVAGLALLTVSDEGRGVSADEKQEVFERFWRGQTTGPGSGLGLAIVKATAERLGGRAYVEGATFTIELPAVRDLSESEGRKDGDEREPKKGSR